MVLKKSQKSLKKWTEQEWDYVSAKDRRKPKSERKQLLKKESKKLNMEKLLKVK